MASKRDKKIGEDVIRRVTDDDDKERSKRLQRRYEESTQRENNCRDCGRALRAGGKSLVTHYHTYFDKDTGASNPTCCTCAKKRTPTFRCTNSEWNKREQERANSYAEFDTQVMEALEKKKARKKKTTPAAGEVPFPASPAAPRLIMGPWQDEVPGKKKMRSAPSSKSVPTSETSSRKKAPSSAPSVARVKKPSSSTRREDISALLATQLSGSAKLDPTSATKQKGLAL
jgi:hypothetical protein